MTMTSPNRMEFVAELVERHQQGVWRYLRYLGCDEHDAADITQDTFFAVLHVDLEELPQASLAKYLHTTAKNLLLSKRRRLRREVLLDNVAELAEVWEEHGGNEVAERYKEAMAGCLQSLDDRERSAVEARYGEKRSRADMAKAFGISEEGVKALLQRCRGRLRDCIQRKTHQ